ncbi:hypothetical protein K437DRAFT_41872 [Tilletiaria anomala UBC 951]|uniref:Uncharacterized protein n=1 Tax=Tilletiaria anomala (strain ATCC 24038 / CBS 436.72 / UBC 951) TaxID=1037660 RepID=A0A066VFA8_TILAU|nr:uncharacterized protein K437DRAFT_41872 [Tilletiaria anomala UBC 951]KDN37270.1 hypothetical protein K437DRAFT_41872 [Tilletiaria anomala UBC 951]
MRMCISLAPSISSPGSSQTLCPMPSMCARRRVFKTLLNQAKVVVMWMQPRASASMHRSRSTLVPPVAGKGLYIVTAYRFLACHMCAKLTRIPRVAGLCKFSAMRCNDAADQSIV